MAIGVEDVDPALPVHHQIDRGIELSGLPSLTAPRRQEGPVSIDRADQERIVIVSGTLADRDLGSVMADLEQRLRDVYRPDGYEFKFGGEYEEQQENFRELTFAAILALILVYMVMASQFESLRDPFIILFSIPLAAIGVIGILILTQTRNQLVSLQPGPWTVSAALRPPQVPRGARR